MIRYLKFFWDIFAPSTLNKHCIALIIGTQKYTLFYNLNFQFPLPHSRGSSHGQSRGIRTAYKEPFLAEMMADAFQQWKNLEIESGVKIFQYVLNVVLLSFPQALYLIYVSHIVGVRLRAKWASVKQNGNIFVVLLCLRCILLFKEHNNLENSFKILYKYL